MGPRHHWFDGDVYAFCPECNAPECSEEIDIDEGNVWAMVKSKKVESTSEKKKRGLFRRKKENKDDMPKQDETLERKEEEIEKIMLSALPSQKSTTRQTGKQQEYHTVPLLEGDESWWEKQEEEERRRREEQERRRKEIEECQKREEEERKDVLVEHPQKEKTERTEPITPIQKSKQSLDNLKKISAYAKNECEPVTGWLVVIDGNHYGESFPLKTGQNFIGRDYDMDVALEREPSVSKQKHAIVIFEPKKRMFWLQSGGSSGLTYCNEEIVFAPMQLNAYDSIQVGEVKMLFVPFCNEKFHWEVVSKGE